MMKIELMGVSNGPFVSSCFLFSFRFVSQKAKISSKHLACQKTYRMGCGEYTFGEISNFQFHLHFAFSVYFNSLLLLLRIACLSLCVLSCLVEDLVSTTSVLKFRRDFLLLTSHFNLCFRKKEKDTPAFVCIFCCNKNETSGPLYLP